MSPAKIDIGHVYAAQRDVVRHALLGDLRLREDSVLALTPSNPALYALSGFGLRLRFAMQHTEERGFLFRLWKKKRTDTIVDLRLRLELQAALQAPRPPEGEPKLTFAGARFLRRPRAGQFQLDLGRGRVLDVLDEGDITFADRHTGSVLGEDEWPFETFIQLLDALRRGLVDGERRDPRPYRIGSNEVLDELLQSLARSQTEVAREIATAQEPVDTESFRSVRRRFPNVVRRANRIRRLHPDLRPRYRIAQLSSRLLLRWNEDADLITKAGSRAFLRTDVDASLLSSGSRPELRMFLRLPDFLTRGHRYFDIFLGAVRGKGRDRVRGTVAKKLGGKARAEAFLQAVDPAKALFMRVGPKDRDVVLLRGNGGDRVLLLVDFEVTRSFPEVEAEVDDVEFLGGRIGTRVHEPEVDEDVISDHIRLLTKNLLRWEERT